MNFEQNLPIIFRIITDEALASETGLSSTCLISTITEIKF